MIYEGILSIECYVLFNMFLQGTESTNDHHKRLSYSIIYKYPHSKILKFLSENRKRRHVIYHVFVALFGLLTTFFMNIYNYYGTSSKIVSDVCWVNKPWYNATFGLLPMAIAILIVVILNTNVIYMISQAFGKTATESLIIRQQSHDCCNDQMKLLNNESSNQPHVSLKNKVANYMHTNCSTSGVLENTACVVDKLIEPLQPCLHCVTLFSRLSPRSKHAFFRLVAIPISFVLLAMPGIVRRILIMRGGNADHMMVLTTITIMLATSGGTVNALIWLVTDEVVQNDWYIVLDYIKQLVMAVLTCNTLKFNLLWKQHESYVRERRHSSFSGPESEYSTSNDSTGDTERNQSKHEIMESDIVNTDAMAVSNSYDNTDHNRDHSDKHRYKISENDHVYLESSRDVETAIENGIIDEIC